MGLKGLRGGRKTRWLEVAGREGGAESCDGSSVSRSTTATSNYRLAGKDRIVADICNLCALELLKSF